MIWVIYPHIQVPAWIIWIIHTLCLWQSFFCWRHNRVPAHLYRLINKGFWHMNRLWTKKGVYLCSRQSHPLPNFVHKPRSLTGKLLKPGLTGGVSTDLDPLEELNEAWRGAGMGKEGGKGICTSTQGFQVVSLRRPVKGGKSSQPAPATAPELWAENPWHVQGLMLEKGEGLKKTPVWAVLFLLFGTGASFKAVILSVFKNWSRGQGNRESIRDQGCWRRRRLKSDAARLGIELGELTLGRNYKTSTHFQTTNKHDCHHPWIPALLFFPHGIKTFCNSLI